MIRSGMTEAKNVNYSKYNLIVFCLVIITINLYPCQHRIGDVYMQTHKCASISSSLV